MKQKLGIPVTPPVKMVGVHRLTNRGCLITKITTSFFLADDGSNYNVKTVDTSCSTFCVPRAVLGTFMCDLN